MFYPEPQSCFLTWLVDFPIPFPLTCHSPRFAKKNSEFWPNHRVSTLHFFYIGSPNSQQNNSNMHFRFKKTRYFLGTLLKNLQSVHVPAQMPSLLMPGSLPQVANFNG